MTADLVPVCDDGHLPVELAVKYHVPAVWLANSDPTPGFLAITRLGDWWTVGIVPDGWAALWLADDPAEPWGFWRSNTPLAQFATAAAALHAALATNEVEQR